MAHVSPGLIPDTHIPEARRDLRPDVWHGLREIDSLDKHGSPADSSTWQLTADDIGPLGWNRWKRPW